MNETQREFEFDLENERDGFVTLCSSLIEEAYNYCSGDMFLISKRGELFTATLSEVYSSEVYGIVRGAFLRLHFVGSL